MKYRYGFALLAGLIMLGAALPVEAQSVFTTRGLGFPLEPADARERGLGGAAMGLPEQQITWSNVAAMVGLQAPGMVVAYQHDDVSADTGVRTFEGSTARFPLLMGAFPAGERLVIGVGYGSFLDQNWRVEEADTLVLAGDSVPVTDLLSSEGGVARFRLAAAYRLGTDFGVGAGIDLYTGTVERVQGRLFPGEILPGCCRSSWSYRGLGYTLGGTWSPGEAMDVGVSVTGGGRLDANPTGGGAVETSYSLPVTVRGGASGRIGANTLVAISGDWAGWSSLDDALAGQGGAQDAWSARGGVEWDGLVVRDRTVPLRVGARTAALPFRWGTGPDIAFATERAFSAGAGILFADGATVSDFALEFGSRGGADAGIDESFVRFVLSVRVLGR